MRLLNVVRRVALLLLVVWTVVSLVTLLIELVPGDPAVATLGEQATVEQIEQFREKHGLNRPAFFFTYARDEQGARHMRWHGADNRYVDYWRGILHGDMGTSFRTDRPVLELILQRYPATIELAVAALLVAVTIAVPLGVVAGTRRNTWLDNLLSVIALVGISLPSFVLGPLLIFIFAVWLNWLAPSAGGYWSDLILPAVTLGAALSALLTRMVRSVVVGGLEEDHLH